MIPGLEHQRYPDWLKNLTGLETLPIRDVLNNSLYYPSSGRDGDPVRYLSGHVHSFIYVDYGLEHKEVIASLHDDKHSFKGYSLLDCRDISEGELTPHGWNPIPPDPLIDGDPKQYCDYIKKPFAIWSVHERSHEYGEEHGPKRFSLIYLCADGATEFQALYRGNQCKPEVVAIIQPGKGFGHNWTDFCDPQQIFGRSALQNPYGSPRYLLYGGWGNDYRKCCWPSYSTLLNYWKTVDGELGLWSA